MNKAKRNDFPRKQLHSASFTANILTSYIFSRFINITEAGVEVAVIISMQWEEHEILRTLQKGMSAEVLKKLNFFRLGLY